MALTFDAASHSYRFDGRPVPGVTELLGKLHSFAGVPLDVLEAASERGTYAHALCEAFDQGDLDEDRVPPEYQGYITAWKAFLAEYRPNWEGIEERGFCSALCVAGTLDRRGVMEKWGASKVILDIKTGARAHPVWGLQTSAYRAIAAERDLAYATARRATVQLAADGRFTVVEWLAPDDFSAFTALARLFHWGARHGC